MIFSLLIPTRDRIPGLQRFLESIKKTTVGYKDIELLFGYDSDDKSTEKVLINFKHQYLDLDIKYYQRNRSEWVNNDYYNWLAQKSEGKYIWALADDVVLLHRGWDTIISQKLKAYLSDKVDKLVCAVVCHDTHFIDNDKSGALIPSFPLISRETFNKIGFLLHKELPTWGADMLLAKLYGGIDRLLVIDDFCFLNHVSHHTGKESDNITRRMGSLCAKYAKNPNHSQHILEKTLIPKQIEELRKYIKEKNR